MKLYTTPHSIVCANCGYAVGFDSEPTCWTTGVIRGRCNRHGCENQGKTFRFPLTVVEVEFIEEEQQP